jgi:hypothetical protein
MLAWMIYLPVNDQVMDFVSGKGKVGTYTSTS